jgi:ABC-type nitrate/sulfonate/bicarbonate transport system substrate-binding protein
LKQYCDKHRSGDRELSAAILFAIAMRPVRFSNGVLDRLRRGVVLLAMAWVSSAGDAHASKGASLKVIVPDNGNLQYMSFWVAKGAGYFADEGIDVVLVVPPAPQLTTDFVLRKQADVAVLPPPMYLELIAQKFPFVLVATLLRNDPINLVVRKSVMDERKLSPEAPLVERLRGLKGLRVGVAPHPPARLRALFASEGMNADVDIQMVILRGVEQNQAFVDHQVDALYAHTPFLEKALVSDGAVMLVNQSAGEVPTLAMRQIHALAFSRTLADASPETVTSMVRAIYRAERLIHTSPAQTIDALLHELPKLDPKELAKIVEIYTPAIPDAPQVSVDGVLPALALFPAGRPAPDLTGINLAAYVAPQFAEAVVSESRLPAHPRAIAALVVGAIAALLLAMRGRRRRVPST